jgi:F-type H+-transporting ATPase subunit delta
MSEATAGYADAILAVATADGTLDVVKSELNAFAQAVEGNDELRTALGNNLLPATVRGQIVDDILGGRSADSTRAIVGLIVSSGRGAQLGEIVSAFIEKAAADSGRRVATVRTAVPLSDDQRDRLAAALRTQTGGDVELQVIVDPAVVGGAVTTIGDSVIDGSLRTRLNKMREVL